jgi:hypothetical protein
VSALPPNNTGRVLLDYFANGQGHTMQWRYTGLGAPSSGFLEDVDSVLIALNPFMPTDWEFQGWRYVPASGTFSTVITSPPTTFDGARDVELYAAPAYLDVPGRSTGGRRIRFFALGVGIAPRPSTSASNDYRLTIVENADAAALVLALSTGGFCAIDANDVNWKPYVNLGFNAYWQGKARG